MPIATGISLMYIGPPCGPYRKVSAPVAQLDRAPDYESGGRRFDSFRVRHFSRSEKSSHAIAHAPFWFNAHAPDFLNYDIPHARTCHHPML